MRSRIVGILGDAPHFSARIRVAARNFLAKELRCFAAWDIALNKTKRPRLSRTEK
jgi:hypothetical protein